MTTYHALDDKTVADYVRSRPAAKDLFDSQVPLKATEVGDGNLNLVFIVQNERNLEQSVVVKQALPFLRVAGDSDRHCSGRDTGEYEIIPIAFIKTGHGISCPHSGQVAAG